MKMHSGLKLAAMALLVSTAGFAITQVGPHFNPAFAESMSTTAQNTDQPTDGRGRWKERRENLFKELNLTTDQQAQIKTIREQEQGKVKALRDDMKAAWDKMKSLSANATDGELRQQHQTMQDLHQKMGDQRFETMLKIRAVLTPEQRAKMAQLKENFGGRKGHHSRRLHGSGMMGPGMMGGL